MGTAAVWSKDTASGEKIEFLVAHRGTSRQQGRIVGISGQANLGAISLAGLELLGRHTSALTVPIGLLDNEMMTAQVRVPRFGAYAVNKAVTFPKGAVGREASGIRVTRRGSRRRR